MAKSASIRSIHHSADKRSREAALTAVQSIAANKSEMFAAKLLENPELTAGLKDFGILVELLLKGGQRERLMKLADSRQLRPRERALLVTALLCSEH